MLVAESRRCLSRRPGEVDFGRGVDDAAAGVDHRAGGRVGSMPHGRPQVSSLGADAGDEKVGPGRHLPGDGQLFGVGGPDDVAQVPGDRPPLAPPDDPGRQTFARGQIALEVGRAQV